MRRFFIVFFVSLGLVLIQTSFLPVLLGPDISPSLYLALVMSLYVENKVKDAYFSALVGGLIVDLLSTHTVGMSPLILTALLLVLSFARKYIYRSWVIRVLLSLVVFSAYTVLINLENLNDMSQVFSLALSTLIISFIFRFVVGRIFDENRLS